MQRGAAPTTSSPVSHQESNQRPSKRRKTDGDIPRADVDVDQVAVQAVLATEERKRQEVLDRQASEAGDTKWQMTFNGQEPFEQPNAFFVVNAGYGSIDAVVPNDSAELVEENATPVAQFHGRKSFGNFGKVKEVRAHF